MMRTSEMPEGTFIMKDKKQALERFKQKDKRDVWAVYTVNRPVLPVWVETGPVTTTMDARLKAETKAIQAVQVRTGQRVTDVEYDP